MEWIVNSDKGISWFVLEAWVAQLNEFHGRGWEIPSLKQLATLMNSGNFTAQCTRRSKNTSLGTENTGHVTTIYLNEIFSKGCGNVWSSDDKDGDTQYYYMFSSGEKAETPVMDCGTDCPQAFAVRKHSGK